MATSKQSNETKATARRSGQARRPTRRRAEPSYEASAEIRGEAVLELVRLAVEYEAPHAHVNPYVAPIDQEIRAVVRKISNADAVLEKVVQIALEHRDRRRERIQQVRTAQALREIADFVREKNKGWSAEQRRRKKKGDRSHPLRSSEPFRRELTHFVRDRFAWWEVPLTNELRERIVEAVIPVSKIDLTDKNGGLLRRLAIAIGHEVIGVGPETLERICAALGGHEQSAGRFKKPEDVERALGDEPVGDSEILRYVLGLLVAKGHPQGIADAIMKVWNDEHAKIASSGPEASLSSPGTRTEQG